MVKLFECALKSTYFVHQGYFYEQVEGVRWGSPLSPMVADFFIEAFEAKALEQASLKPSLYQRFVVDSLLIWKHGQNTVDGFAMDLNQVCENIQLTKEQKSGRKLPFLDILIIRHACGSIGRTFYRKPTHTVIYLYKDTHLHPA